MPLKATPWTAAAAGAWANVGLLLLRAWLARHPVNSPAILLAMSAAGLALLVVFPVHYAVFGADQPRFQRQWFKDPAEVRRFTDVAQRLLIWFAASALTTILCAKVLDALTGA